MRPTLTVSVNLETKKALYTPGQGHIKKYGLSATEPTEVEVFGLFPVSNEDETDAYFVVKLPDGRCCYAGIGNIQFIEKEADEDEAPDRD